ncbi:MAG: penicillin-binding protein activator [Pseudomonadota bacterium]
MKVASIVPFARAALPLMILALAACQQPGNRPSLPSSGAGTGSQPATTTTEPAAPVQKVGVLVPLTGRASDVGQDILQAVQMAVIERGGEGLEIVPRDTGSTGDQAVIAAQALLEQDDVDVILGPLFGSSAARVAGVARPSNTLVLSFSSQSEVAGNGLFILGYLPEEQVRRVAGFAISRGYGRIAALAPADAYGRKAAEGLRASLSAADGGELVGLEFYAADGSDAAAKAAALRQRGGGGLDAPPAFDALLLADGGQRLEIVSRALSEQGLDPVDMRMLGTMLWQDDRRTLQSAALRGGWYAGVAETTTRGFRDRFLRAFGRSPHPLAVLGYDGLLIAADAAANKATAASRLTDPRGYAGEAGIVRLLPSGTAEHGLAVLELTGSGPTVIDPAPVRFLDAGF